MIDIGARRTEQLLPYPALVDELRQVMREHRAGRVKWDDRSGVTLASGTSVWSMVAADEWLAVNKTVTMNPSNQANGRPTVGGNVSVFDVSSGASLMVLDGVTLTARRTAAVTSIAVDALCKDVQSALIVGSGVAAKAHVECLIAVNGVRGFKLYGRNRSTVGRLAQFARGLGAACEIVTSADDAAAECDVVIAATSSAVPVLSTWRRDVQLVASVGAHHLAMAELSAELVRAADQVTVDNPAAARKEAGDLAQAGVDWDSVWSLEMVLNEDLQMPFASRRIFKNVGHSLWDLAAARVAKRNLDAQRMSP